MITQPNKNGNQREKIIWYFLDNLDRKVKSYEFSKNLGILQYNARIHELRKEGRPIINETMRATNKGKQQKHSDYYLLTTHENIPM